MTRGRVRAAGIVVHEGKVLVLRKHRDGRSWAVFPGGGVEQGEPVASAVAREVAEETGVRLTVGRLRYRVEFEEGGEFRFHEATVDGDAGELRSEDPADATSWPEWVPVEELPGFVLYPLEVRDWLVEDLTAGAPRDLVRLLRSRRDALRT
jgi:ADP-ribose pyrophosphatase YjhB (NUDIX family)